MKAFKGVNEGTEPGLCGEQLARTCLPYPLGSLHL